MSIQPNAACSTEPAPSRGEGQVYCTECGTASPAGAKFCSECGEPVGGAVKPPKTAAVPEPAVGPESQPARPIQPPARPARPAVSLPAAAPAVCHCGRALPSDASFCPRCGVRVGETVKRFFLVELTPEGNGARHEVLQDGLIIGKDPGCDVVIAGDDYVSRRHARVTRSDGLFFIEDLQSSNCTSIRVRRPIVLEAGDEIILGTTTLRFEETH